MALALKEEGDSLFDKKEYVSAIAKYEAAIRKLDDWRAGPTTPAASQLHLDLWTSRLDAFNKSNGDSGQARTELLDYLCNHADDNWTRFFGTHKLCRAYFHLSRSFEMENNLEQASDMLQICLYFEPNDQNVQIAFERVQIPALKELVRLGIFKNGTAADLSIDCIMCVHCQEDIHPEDLCIQYRCKHGFHQNCAMRWMQLEGADDQRAVEEPPKTCPSCRAEVLS
ncbi:hypothetical protein IQ07DRAFT_606400 [Pyrenochaeta sp. DS3sAY3a]|nr:hypothetical protein IQ07DRAFT_606400 [Pyrenochaeta sp. DS3sAY3a]